MGRIRRVCQGGMVYHALNRANGRLRIFRKEGDYKAFEAVLQQGCDRVSMRLLSYCIMPNHWHLVLWPRADGDLSRFMQWLTLTHTQRWHAAHGSGGWGHVYQGRYKSFPVQSDDHYLTVCRYVERNALQAELVERAEDWRWNSLWHRMHDESEMRSWLSDGPLALPQNWSVLVNRPMRSREVEGIQTCLMRCRPFGTPTWTEDMIKQLGLETTIRSPGRPKKIKNGT